MKTRFDCICNQMQLVSRIFLFQVYFYLYFQNIISRFLGMINNNIAHNKEKPFTALGGNGLLKKMKTRHTIFYHVHLLEF